MTTSTHEIPVLIVGGGPVGLALALELNHHGTPCLVVEQAAATGTEPLAKAGTFNERTIEFCRRWGLVDRIAASFPDDLPRDTVYCTALDGEYLGRSVVACARERGIPPVSPEMMRRCPQYLFDPILADGVKAGQHSAVRYNARFERFEQDEHGVTATLTDLTTGEPFTVRSQYLVGCDGVRSAVRQQLGIALEVIAQMDYSLSAMIRIDDIDRYHAFGRCERFMFIGPEGTWANMTAVDGRGLWRFTVVGMEETLHPEKFDVRPVIERAFGQTGMPYTIERVVPWRRAQTLARRFGQGRVWLAGDAIHTTSPTGGHGVNTGIGDAVGLAWALTALTQGWGGPRLLEAYEAERRPVALRNFGISTENYRVWVANGMDNVLDPGPKGVAARRNIGNLMQVGLHQEWYSQGVALGYRYDDSPVIVPDGTPPTADHPSFYLPTARPGHRAPHAWLADGRSVIDLFGRGFVLLDFGAPAAATQALAEAARSAGVPLRVEPIDQPEIRALYQRALVLVRPDGHVAWRGDAAPEDARGLFDRVRGAA
jgi:2-polyprenyl-6-methoxyphenol hydroxylase-like FAD-dependent oxidoreductase